MRYRVFLRGYIPMEAEVEVEACSEEEATEIAMGMALDDEVDFTAQDGVCDIEVAEVQTIEGEEGVS